MVNLKFNHLADNFPFIGVAVWVVILLAAPLRKPDWELRAGGVQGQHLPAVAGHCALR